MQNDTDHIDEFADWIEGLMRGRGYDIDSPRGGGKSKLADDAGVHRAAITRLLQRQSMPDLETMRGLARALGVPVRDVLIRSGKLTEDDLPRLDVYAWEGASSGRRMTAAEAADALGIPEHLRTAFIQVVEQFTRPGQTEGRGAGERATG